MITLRTSGNDGYAITVGKDLLKSADKYFNLNRRVFIVTDEGVPRDYAEAIARQSKISKIYTVPEGEGSKSISTYEKVLLAMCDFGMERNDCLVAVGGGVVGDLTGFLASTYMRGIDYYGVPTTLLSQVDSSVGAKCAVNLGGIKNIVGSFYRPRAVLIDTDTLKTLPRRILASGVAESIKMAICRNSEFFGYLEENDFTEDNAEYIITESLKIKIDVVEKDEHESGLRKILNFGHTLGHGIEAVEGLGGLYHGECVALGMLPLTDESVKERLKKALGRHGLPTVWQGDISRALKYTVHDKKAKEGFIDAIICSEAGHAEIVKMDLADFSERVKKYVFL